MIFEINIDVNFKGKARFVSWDHDKSSTKCITYYSVVTYESVWINFILKYLDGPMINESDIGNTYLNDPRRKNIWTIEGDEFGMDEGRVIITVRELYGLKIYGVAWWYMLDQTIQYIG